MNWPESLLSLTSAKACTILRMAGDKGHAPADHVEALGHRVNLDADLLGAIHLQEAQGRPVEAQEDVGGVLHDDDPGWCGRSR